MGGPVGKRGGTLILETSTQSGSPEIELLLCCARVGDSPRSTERAASLILRGVRWDRLLRAASRHGVVPLLYRQLDRAHREAVPHGVLEQLRDYSRSTRLHNLRLTGELVGLLNTLEARGIQAIPYKGPILASLVYGDLSLREFGDLDILVPESRAPEASELLLSLGYAPEYELTGAQRAAFVSYERQYLFAREGGAAVELHWTVTPRSVSFLLDPKQLLARAERVSFAGRETLSLSPEDLLLTLCVHGSAHRWERLGWICDVAELVRTAGDVDWDSLTARAAASHTRRMLLLGLLLARDLLDAEVPERVLRQARADAVVTGLAETVRERLFSEEYDPESVDEDAVRWRFQLRMLDRARDKIRYCVNQVTTPTLLDREFMPLPVALYPLYRVLRPIRLGSNLCRRLMERFRGRSARA